MKITSVATAIFFIMLLSAGLVSVARWFHPATFNITTLWALLIVAFVSAGIIVLSHD